MLDDIKKRYKIKNWNTLEKSFWQKNGSKLSKEDTIQILNTMNWDDITESRILDYANFHWLDLCNWLNKTLIGSDKLTRAFTIKMFINKLCWNPHFNLTELETMYEYLYEVYN